MFTDPALGLGPGPQYVSPSMEEPPWPGAGAAWDALSYQAASQDLALPDSGYSWPGQDEGGWSAWMSEALKENAMLPAHVSAALRAQAAASYYGQGSLFGFGGGGSLWDPGVDPTVLSNAGAPGLAGADTDAQQRKVFVGGVPQDMEAKDLTEMFGSYGDVQQAWVQRFRKNAATKNGTKHTHRGFGFVVFVEPDAIHRLLGLSPSRMLSLKDGRRLEVKRAVSSSVMKAFESEPAEPEQRAATKTVHNI